jgi:UDP-3-O-[3-hydroxymyristoyl] glucosamine N-acyltransferase
LKKNKKIKKIHEPILIFMHSKKNVTLETLKMLTQSRLVGNPQHVICDVADLTTATAQDASFFANPLYQQAMKNSLAGVIFVNPQTALTEGKNYLVCEEPSKAFQQVVELLRPPRKTFSGFKGIHPSAVIHETVQLGEGVSVGPGVVLDEGVKIGKDTCIGAGVYIGPDTVVGESCIIHPRVVIREDCWVGHRVVIQPGVVIGSCGFGYTTDQQGKHVKLNQVGNVCIEDDVEIGANTTVDRARFKSTRIGEGSKLDNLVQIGHGVTLGRRNLIVAQVGIAGTTSTDEYVTLAGQVGVAGHLHLGRRVTVTAKSGVSKSLWKEGVYRGIPALPVEEYNRHQVFLRQIEKYVKKLWNDVTRRLEEIERTIITIMKK